MARHAQASRLQDPIATSPSSDVDATKPKARLRNSSMPSAPGSEPPVIPSRSPLRLTRSEEGLKKFIPPSEDVPPHNTRPPIRPGVSFANASKFSYYSATAPSDLEEKSRALAAAEELLFEKSQSGIRFYSTIAILCTLNLLCGVNATSLAAALPTIASELDISAVATFWTANSYLLAATASQPLAMRLSPIVGGKMMLFLGVLLWAAGSVLSTLPASILILFIGRGVTGVGGGLVGILIPLLLHQVTGSGTSRPYARSCVQSAFWFGCFIGPFAGGVLAQSASWRYIFYINLPVCILGLVVIPFVLKLPTIPSLTLRRLIDIDYLGWILLTGAITSFTVAISWAGIKYSWTDWQTLVPAGASALGLALWVFWTRFTKHPILPVSFFRQGPATVCCLGTLLHGLVFTTLIHFLPLLLHAAAFTPTSSGLGVAPWTLTTTLGSALGTAMTNPTHRRWTTWISCACATAGTALLLLAKPTNILATTLPFGPPTGIALGLLAPCLATSLQTSATNDEEIALAAPLHTFTNTLGSTLGLALGSCLFLNRTHSNNPLQRQDFVPALQALWMALAGCCGLMLVLASCAFVVPGSQRARRKNRRSSIR